MKGERRDPVQTSVGSAMKAFLNTLSLIYLGIYPTLLFVLMRELQYLEPLVNERLAVNGVA